MVTNIDTGTKAGLDLGARMWAYEEGELSGPDTLALFADLVRTGQAWALQGEYGRVAHGLIRHRWISPEGEVIKRLADDSSPGPFDSPSEPDSKWKVLK